MMLHAQNIQHTKLNPSVSVLKSMELQTDKFGPMKYSKEQREAYQTTYKKVEYQSCIVGQLNPIFILA